MKKDFALVVAACLSLPVYGFIAYKNAKIDMLYADAISDNNFLQAPFIQNDINIQAIHTHLLKWPIAILENAIGFNFRTHAIISFLLLLAMNAAIIYLCYIFSKRNTLITAFCMIILTSVELMTGISANEGTLTMITIRNIELPLTIAAITVLIHQRKLVAPWSILSAIVLAIIFVTDQLLLFTSVIGLVFYALYTFMGPAKKASLTKDKVLYLGVILGAIISKLIVFVIQATGIANFYEMHNTNDKLTFVSSFSALFDSVLNNTGKIFDVFGAGFFGQQLELSPLYLINIALLLTTLTLAITLFKDRLSQKDSIHRTLLALFCMYFLAMLIFTVLIPRELAGRYFAFLPILGILLIAKKFKGFHPTLDNNKYKVIFTFSSIALGILLFAMAINANDIYYRPKYTILSQSLGDTSNIVSILQKEKTDVYITMDVYERGYWSSQIIKQQYDEKLNRKLAIGSVFCDNFIIDRQFTRRSWVSPSGSKVAVRVQGCDIKKIITKLGDPTVSYEITKDDHLLIYRHDVRSKFDTKQFDSNTFTK